MVEAAWPAILGALASGADLPPDEARWAMTEILEGRAVDAQIAAFAIALRAKGESPAEVSALAEAMLEHARRVPVPPGEVLLDVVGTGGDASHSVNLSTMSALVAAACGAKVAKHGNRAATSATGTADVLEQLGVVIDLGPDEVAASIVACGVGFCFAPVFHPAMRHAATARKALGIPTVFNILGPLTNPAGARTALIGCADSARAPLMAEVLAARGVQALVVRGEDGLDEVSIHAPTRVLDTTSGRVEEWVIEPQALGIPAHDPALLRGGDPVRNAALLRQVLGLAAAEDASRIAAIRDAVALNAAAALAVHASVDGAAVSADSVAAKFPVAEAALADGAAADVLTRFIEMTRNLRPSA